MGREVRNAASSTRVLLVGQARWTREVAAGLKGVPGVSVDAMLIDTPKDALSMLSPSRFRRADVVVRVGFRPGARTIRGVVFDAVFNVMRGRRGAPVVYYWLGTDAANAIAEESGRSGPDRFRRMAESATHVADSDSVREELATLGLSATTAWLPAPNAPQEGDVVPLPGTFTVLSYVPDARVDFYDGQTILDVAERLPDAHFKIVGGTGSWLSRRPSNVEFLGWRDDIGLLYDQSSVLVRMLQHDSVSCMVVEALAHGRAVIYSSPFPNTIQVPFNDADDLERALKDLAARIEEQGAPVSAQTVAWARKLAEPASCYQALADEIVKAVTL